MQQYKFAHVDSKTIQKYGVDISLYGMSNSAINIVYEEVKEGHFEEFLNTVSTCTWFIFEGKGTFVINDEKIEVGPKDIITVPPNNRIHYFGNMKMTLITSPAFSPQNERHIRDIKKEESPYYKSLPSAISQE